MPWLVWRNPVFKGTLISWAATPAVDIVQCSLRMSHNLWYSGLGRFPAVFIPFKREDIDIRNANLMFCVSSEISVLKEFNSSVERPPVLIPANWKTWPNFLFWVWLQKLKYKTVQFSWRTTLHRKKGKNVKVLICGSCVSHNLSS